MSDSQEKSDDLIAELARLMATNAGGAEPAPKPSVIKLPPLAEATVRTSPVRIPGMDTSSSQPRDAAPADAQRPAAPPSSPVRIPGMAAPGVTASPAAPAATNPAAPPVSQPPPSRPIGQFDTGRASSPSSPVPSFSAAAGEPPRLPPAPPPRPDAVAQLADMKFDSKPAEASAAPSSAIRMPSPSTAPQVAAPSFASQSAAKATPQPPAGAPVEAPRNAAGMHDDAGTGDDPDTGDDAPDMLSDDRFEEQDQQRQPDQPDDSHQPTTAADADPIAALINAELDRSLAPEKPAQPAPSRPEPSRAEPQLPASSYAAPTPVAARPQSQVLPNPLRPRPEPEAHTSPPLASFGTSRSAQSREADRFSVMPVGAEDSEPTIRTESRSSAYSAGDPMDEIETLIGEAVRVELEGPDVSGRRPSGGQPAPVVPPLGRPSSRGAETRGREPMMDSPEAAILAAAAATGARVDRVEAPTDDEDRPSYRRATVKPPRTSGLSSGMRQYVGIGVSAVLLLAAGFGLYWVLGMGGPGDPTSAPVLTADAGPVKVEPEPETVETASSGSVIFDELDGGTTASDRAEALVSRDETAGASATDVAAIAPPPTTDEQSESGLANRKVRTVTVRPDGTIVAGETSLAGSEALPVDRPNVPEIAGGADLDASDLLTAAAGDSRTAPASATELDPISALVADSVSATTAPLATPEPLEVAAIEEPAQVFDPGIVAPVPMPRPTNRAALGTGTVIPASSNASDAAPLRPASTPLAAVNQPATPAASGAYVQLSSQKTEGDAQASLRNLQSRMGGILGGRSLDVRRVDLGAKGVWYRVVLPVQTFQDATQTCATVKANGIDCVPING